MEFKYSALHNSSLLGRRCGLNKADYQGPHLLQSINVSEKDNQDKMPPRAATKKSAYEVAEEMKHQPLNDDNDDILRPPDSSSDEEAENPADIKPTFFKSASQEPKLQDLKFRHVAARGERAAKETFNGLSRGKRGASKKTSSASFSSQLVDSPKRKSREESAKLGSGMEDPFGRVTTNKKRKALYGSSSQASLSSQKSKDSVPSQGMNIPMFSHLTKNGMLIISSRRITCEERVQATATFRLGKPTKTKCRRYASLQTSRCSHH